jgi:hypothetical protein
LKAPAVLGVPEMVAVPFPESEKFNPEGSVGGEYVTGGTPPLLVQVAL